MPSSSPSASTAARNPTRPKLTPSTGPPVRRKRRSPRSIVPSPPRTTARSAPSSPSPASASPCFSTSSSEKSSSTPTSAATACSRRSAAPIVSGLPCVMTAARLTSADCVVDPALELIGKLRPLAVHEMQEELAVSLRAGQAGVYDPGDLRLPGERRFGGLPQDPTPHLGVAHDAAPRLRSARLELRLDEDDRLPARRCEPERRWQRRAHADERDVAGDQLRRERQLAQGARIRAF